MKQKIERDDFGDNLGVGFDDGDVRGEWKDRPQLIIPKLGEVALLLGLSVEVDQDPSC